jgi:uncharacterized protein
VLLTNGTTLTPGLLQWLRDEGIRLAISLDGLGPAHDGQRASENGAGSFARIAEGIERAQASGLTPHLSVTVTAHNVDGLAEVVAFALDRGLPFNLNFVRPAPGRPDLTPDPERLIAGLQGALSEMERRLQSTTGNLQSAICNLLDRCDLSAPHRYPCGAGHAYIVVGPGGELARCHMEMGRTVGTVWEETRWRRCGRRTGSATRRWRRRRSAGNAPGATSARGDARCWPNGGGAPRRPRPPTAPSIGPSSPNSCGWKE